MVKKQYQYQKFISDISGQDPLAHNNNPEEVVKVVRRWLNTASGRRRIPGGGIIWSRYQDFLSDLPELTQNHRLEIEDLESFKDYTGVVAEWLSRQPSSES